MDKEFSADKIQVISALESVRLRPKLYFESCFKSNTLDSLVFEALCHAFDEHFEGNCDEIKLTIWKDSFNVHYNAGMPLDKMKNHNSPYPVLIMTELFACSNLKKHLAVGEEYCQVGMSQINFGSESVILTTFSENKKGTFMFKEGKIESSNIESFESQSSSTEIHIRPSKELFGKLEITAKGVQDKMKKLEGKLTGIKFTLTDKTA